jgi:methionine-gamma-lyase
MLGRKITKPNGAEREVQPETYVQSGGFETGWSEYAHALPIYKTTAFGSPSALASKEMFDRLAGALPPRDGPGDLFYTRYNNPNFEVLEDRLSVVIAGAEKTVLFSSGMAAIDTVCRAFLRHGDGILFSAPLYAGTYKLFTEDYPERENIKSAPFSSSATIENLRATAENIGGPERLRLVWVESPGNPLLSHTDIPLVVEFAKQCTEAYGRRVLVVVDDTFLGPVYQQPLTLGADIAIYSATKYLNGTGTVMAGVAAGSSRDMARVRAKRSLYGPIMSPQDASELMENLKTLFLRMRRHTENALFLVHRLRTHPKVRRVWYPGFDTAPDPLAAVVIAHNRCSSSGAMISFTVEGGVDAAQRFLDNLGIIAQMVSLGCTGSIACIPADTTHRGMPTEERRWLGIPDDLVRLSVGIEDPEDLWWDIETALDTI